MMALESIPKAEVADVCRRHHVCRLAVFGSALRADFRPDSDVDLLVEFRPGARVGFLALARLARELSDVLRRPVDLVPRDGLKPRLREEVLSRTEVLFAE
jgi:predicted nucleotidyltransferase